MEALGDDGVVAPARELLDAVAEDGGDSAVGPDNAVLLQVEQADERGIGLGQLLDEVLAVARLLLGPPPLVGLPAQALIRLLQLAGTLLHDPLHRRVRRLDLRLTRGQVAQLPQRLETAADQHDVLEDDPDGVLQPSPGADDRDAINRARPEDPPQEMVQSHDGRGGDQHPVVAVQGQERERTEDVEVGLDPSAHQVDQQRAHEHLADRDRMSRRRRAGPPPNPTERQADDQTTQDDRCPDVDMDCIRLTGPRVG